MADSKNRSGTIAICLLIFSTTLIAFGPAFDNGFVNFDDPEYITDNPRVQNGLTLSGVVWAFTTGHASNWHPVTWISHMADCQFYGLNPAGHHLTNVLFHAVNSILLFLLLQQMTGSRWRSALVAALFAFHPLHVESVAWASERKDVLSAFFWILTMMAYVKYVHEPNAHGPRQKLYYRLALILFALGLMSKPMLVTLPCVLLLIDFWPLKRGAKDGGQPSLRSLPWGRLLSEKAPFFVLAFAASIVTFLVQRLGGAVSSLQGIPLSARIANALHAYWRYIFKTLWPVDLAAFYPYDHVPSVGVVIIAAASLAAISVLALLAVRRRPYAVTGWFWFLGTLVPTIGIVQVGPQSMADRYMYIPSIGFFVVAVWGLGDLMEWRPRMRKAMAGVMTVVLAVFAIGTWRQTEYWRDGEKLFRHAIDATANNYVAHSGLADALNRAGRTAEAMEHYYKSVEINPRYPEGNYHLGTALLNQGQLDEAIVHFNAALDRNPEYADVHNNLGKALSLKGNWEDAFTHLTEAVELKPNFPQARYNLGTVLLAQSKLDEAIEQFSEAVRLKPDYSDAHGNLGIAYMRKGDPARGLEQLTEASRLRPNDAAAHANLGIAFKEQNKLAEAASEFEAALRIDPENSGTHFNLATIKARQHNSREAIRHYRETLRLTPEVTEALNNLAWILATDPKAELRNGEEAVRLAKKACELTGNSQPGPILTLAAAQAEAGQLAEATASAQKARDLARAAGNAGDVDKSEKLLALFWAGRPFRESE